MSSVSVWGVWCVSSVSVWGCELCECVGGVVCARVWCVHMYFIHCRIQLIYLAKVIKSCVAYGTARPQCSLWDCSSTV